MPRMLANEFVYANNTVPIEENCSDYITPTTPPTVGSHYHHHTQQQTQELQQSHHHHQLPSNNASITMPEATTSHSPIQNVTQDCMQTNEDGGHNTSPEVQQHQHIPTISCNDDVEAPRPTTLHNEAADNAVAATSISSDDMEDFKGFDDDEEEAVPLEIPIENEPKDEVDVYVYSRENLKRHLSAEVDHQYREDSEGVVEAIEVDDEDVEEVDGQIMFKSNLEETPKKGDNCNAIDYNPHTPSKRKRRQDDGLSGEAVSPSHLKTPPDQIVEINSDSTTISQKQKRQQINTKFQLNFNQRQNYKCVAANASANKCSTESTSEFPVSSPSNPQQNRGGGGGGKYPPRPPLLKNTLPADSFERQLAMITACNPQMTLAEKIQGWCCEDDYSDVEDVALFDEEFKRLEEQRKLELTKQKNKRQAPNKQYDFGIFRQMIIDNMNMAQKNKRLGAGGADAGHSSLKQQDETTATSASSASSSSTSESNKNIKHADERPSTSAVAQQQLQQRRCKPNVVANPETGEIKKSQRFVKDSNNKRNQNSTSPPATSSSDNDCFQNSKKIATTAHKRFPKGGIGGGGGGGGGGGCGPQVHIHEKLLCPSSSEEANSQDVPTHMQLMKGPPNPHNNVQRTKAIQNPKEMKKLSSLASSEKIDSFFRLNRLNREIDKPIAKLPDDVIKEEKKFEADVKLLEIEPKNGQQLFKTPTLPSKYSPNPPLQTTEDFNVLYNKFNSIVKPLNLSLESQINSKKEIENKVKIEAKLEPHEEENHATTTNNQDQENDLDEGVYHEQHEFCNYLGLTGMSTATAMANAVAELAQCNMARRSMRVLRQQQQERKEKNAKEETPQKSLKHKRQQVKEQKKAERNEAESLKSKCSNSQASESLTHSTASTKGLSKKLPIKSQSSMPPIVNTTQNEPQIKILCHIANTTNTLEKVSEFECKSIEDNSLPPREPLMRQAKKKMLSLADTHDLKKNEKYSINTKDIKTENVTTSDELNIGGKSRELSSPKRLNKYNKTLRSQRSNQATSDPNIAEEKCSNSIKIENPSPSMVNECFKTKDLFKPEASIDLCSCSNNSIDEGHDGALTPTISLFMKHKLQAALAESRKTKPSIFIVQTLESTKDKGTNSSDKKDATNEKTPSTSPLKKGISNVEIKTQLVVNNNSSENLKVVNNITKKNKNSNNNRSILKMRRSKTFSLRSTPKRELRARKIIFIKSTSKKDKHVAAKKIKDEEVSLKKSLANHSGNKTKEANKKEKRENVTKSFCNAQTETSDLEILCNQNSARTRLMAKATALLQRSKRRMSFLGRARGGGNGTGGKNLRSKLGLKLIAKPQNLQPKEYKTASTSITPPPSAVKPLSPATTSHEDREVLNVMAHPTPATQPSSMNFQENENVVVSSTTNSYDERLGQTAIIIPSSSPITLASTTPVETKDNWTQCEPLTTGAGGVTYLYGFPTATHQMRNPIKHEHGAVLYIYYEVEVLIVVQERLISFWKCPKLANALTTPPANIHNSPYMSSNSPKIEEIYKNFKFSPTSNGESDWLLLGELKRLTHDFEIVVPFGNRICLHNSTPIYVEMRARPLPKNHRECNLLSIYINIYYYHDEEMMAKSNSIQLDNIQSDVKSVNYTTLVDSRYFIITWPQENLLGKTRSGLCKYSITPQLDTLASIREFKSMRHTIRYLECMKDDKLLGLGDSQITIWDHRSGDVLMNYDLEIPLGKHLGSVHFPSQDIEENNMIIFYQFRDLNPNGNVKTPPELLTLACTISHSQPTYRILQQQPLPNTFRQVKNAINTGEHVIVTNDRNDEIWICCNNPRLVALVPQNGGKQRFFSRERSQLIELSGDTLNLDTLSNSVLQLAAGLAWQQRF